MAGNKGLRIACILFIAFTVLLFGVLPGMDRGVPGAAEMIKIGLQEEPKTLNVWRATDSWSNKVLDLIYLPLYVREPKELKLVPWLAEGDPLCDPASLTYTVKLKDVKWADGSELTSEDVAFTANVIKEFKVPRFYSKWEFVKAVETPDRKTVRFVLDKPMAIFLNRTLTTPIIQKKEWVGVLEAARKSEQPLSNLLNHEVKAPVGSGPFMLKEWKQGAYLYLTANPHFFAKGKKVQGLDLGPYVGGILFKVFGTSDAAILALKKGTVDMFWWGIQPGYIPDLRGEKRIRIFENERSALYYLGFNVRKAPFDDVNFRHATAVLIDKDFILNRVLQGYGLKMHSPVPSGNSFWYNPDLPRYGEGLGRQERIRKAHEILSKAGYSWKVPPVDGAGNIVKGEEIRMPDGTPMKGFTILTPPADYDPNRAMSGMMIQEWLREAGIPASAKPMAFSSLMDQVKARHEFDLFVLGYGSLSLDPDYLRNFFHSKNDRPRGWNMSGYHNPEFDRIADQSAETIDENRRRELIWEMQAILMRDIPYYPLYNPKLVEAVSDDFTGWVEMIEGIGNIWSFCSVKPK